MYTYSASLSLTDEGPAIGCLDNLWLGTAAVSESELLLNIFLSDTVAAVFVNSKAPAAVSISLSAVAETDLVLLWSKPAK